MFLKFEKFIEHSISDFSMFHFSTKQQNNKTNGKQEWTEATEYFTRLYLYLNVN